MQPTFKKMKVGFFVAVAGPSYDFDSAIYENKQSFQEFVNFSSNGSYQGGAFMSWFLKKGKKKKAVLDVILSPEEQLLLLNEEKQRCLNQIDHEFERAKRTVKEMYQRRIESANLSEKNLTFQDIVFAANNEKHPLVYEITRSNNYAQYYLISRGRYTPNPFRIEVTNHKNVVFLKAFEEGNADDPFIFLHYDKINDKYSEYGWKLRCDYAAKYQIKHFLFELMDVARQNRMEHHPKVKSHHAAYYAFERTLENQSFQWKEELHRELQVIAAEKQAKVGGVVASFRTRSLLFEQEIEKRVKEEQVMADYERLKAKDESMPRFKPESRSIPSITQNGRVFNPDTQRAMSDLFQRVYGLLQFESLLDVYTQHDLTSLYQKDIQELWFGFIKLDEEMQEKERDRFLSILDKIHLRLDGVDAKLEQLQTVDYEKKMTFLESKYQ